MFAYLILLRPLNGLMSALAVFVGGMIVLGPAVATLPVGLAMLAAFLIMGAGNAINDCCDVDADRINRPGRPLAAGQISHRSALAFSLSLFAVGILLSSFINYVALVIAAVNALLLVAYSVSLQNKLLAGNVAVSYLVGSTFLFGGAAAGNIILPGLLLLLAFFANLAREIVKDIEDVEGDRTSFLKRISSKATAAGERFDIASQEPTMRYKKALLGIAEASLLFAVAVSPLPYLLGLFGFAYLIMLIPADLFLFMAFALLALSERKGRIRTRAKAFIFGKKVYRTVSKYIKVGMLFGLAAFIAGALI